MVLIVPTVSKCEHIFLGKTIPSNEWLLSWLFSASQCCPLSQTSCLLPMQRMMLSPICYPSKQASTFGTNPHVLLPHVQLQALEKRHRPCASGAFSESRTPTQLQEQTSAFQQDLAAWRLTENPCWLVRMPHGVRSAKQRYGNGAANLFDTLSQDLLAILCEPQASIFL